MIYIKRCVRYGKSKYTEKDKEISIYFSKEQLIGCYSATGIH